MFWDYMTIDMVYGFTESKLRLIVRYDPGRTRTTSPPRSIVMIHISHKQSIGYEFAVPPDRRTVPAAGICLHVVHGSRLFSEVLEVFVIKRNYLIRIYLAQGRIGRFILPRLSFLW